MSITNKFYDSVCIASRKVFSNALKEAKHWNSNLMVPMETYVREHHTQLRRRLESVKRIHKASDTVEARLQELTSMRIVLHEQRAEYNTFQYRLDELLLIKEQPSDDEESANNQSAKILNWSHKTNF